jgi:hypothetical protein
MDNSTRQLKNINISLPVMRCLQVKAGLPGEGGSSMFSNGSRSFNINPGNAKEIFLEWGFGGLGRGPSKTSRCSHAMFGGFRFAKRVFWSSYNESSMARPCKVGVIENKLPYTLKDLYNGCIRQMEISRNIVDVSGCIYSSFPLLIAFPFQVLNVELLYHSSRYKH